MSFLSLPSSCLFDGLDDGESVVVPLDGGHIDCPGQVPGMVAGGGEDDSLLGGAVFVSISPTPAVSWRP